MKGLMTIGLLVLSNTFMTLAWYGHLKFAEWKWFGKLSLFAIILISWGIALFEYIFQVPANKMGFVNNGGPFTLVQLKVIQEVITLVIGHGLHGVTACLIGGGNLYTLNRLPIGVIDDFTGIRLTHAG